MSEQQDGLFEQWWNQLPAIEADLQNMDWLKVSQEHIDAAIDAARKAREQK